RRAGRDLGAVEEVQPPIALRRPRPLLAQLGEEAVQLPGTDPARVRVVELFHAVEELPDPAAALRRDRGHRRTLAKTGSEALADLSEPYLGDGPRPTHGE